MTDVKLPTEAELDAAFAGAGLPQVKRVLLADFFRARGMIAPEPIDAFTEAVSGAWADYANGEDRGLEALVASLREWGLTIKDSKLTRMMVVASLESAQVDAYRWEVDQVFGYLRTALSGEGA